MFDYLLNAYVLSGLAISLTYAFRWQIFSRYIEPTEQYQQAKSYVRGKAAEIVMEDAKHRQEVGFKINPGSQTATITYRQHGTNTRVHVPFDRRLVSKMAGAKVYLITEEKQQQQQRLDITSKAGVPFNFTAEQLGGSHFEVEKFGEVSVLEPDQYPFDN